MKHKIVLLFPLLVLAWLASIAGVRAQTATFTALDQFDAYTDGSYPASALVKGNDGNFYGTTQYGVQGQGAVFQITPAGALTILHSFSGGDGARPRAALLLSTDGNFYGTTQTGGTNDKGTVFQIAADGTLKTLYSFTATNSDGSLPEAPLIVGADGNFYGTTQTGGTNDKGTVFQITPAGVLLTLYSFGSVANDGTSPVAALLLGADGNFYGTTQTGGTTGNGTVFKITPAGALTILHSFSGVGSEGRSPTASVIQGTDGNFYGTTNRGGDNDAGTVFALTPTGTLSTLHSFTLSEGNYPSAALIQSGSLFYGTTSSGGTNNNGVVFSIGTASALSTLHNFDYHGGNEGSSPVAALLLGADGNFYGTTLYGGAGNGTVFQITPAGALTTLHSFIQINASGAQPQAGLIRGSDGNFYGTTGYGGANGTGTILKVTPAGAATTLHDFGAIDANGLNTGGAYPQAGLIQDIAGNFYGTTSAGGGGGGGTAFQITPAGVLTSLHDFSNSSGGYNPVADLVLDSAGNLYGTTTGGGVNNDGTIFQIATDGTFSNLHDFNQASAEGSYPAAGLTRGSDGNFYGTTEYGGANNNGTFFQVTPTGTFTTLYNFKLAAGDGTFPTADLILSTDGNFYGTTGYGGTNNNGTVFKITSAGALTTLHSFSALDADSANQDGANPHAGLFPGNDGNFYGTTNLGGANGTGAAFKITPTGAPTTLCSFGALDKYGINTDGAYPYGGLVQSSEGNFYGLNSNGGANGNGTIFTLTVTPTITSPATATGVVGQAFTYQITATNSPTSYAATGLLPGLIVNPTTGMISGTPTAAGAATVTVSATNAFGTATLDVVVTIFTAPVITGELTATAKVGVAFTYQITADNSPTSFGATGLPDGLTVDTATGAISGTPTTAGDFAVAITATNLAGTATATLSLTVIPDLPTVTLEATTTPVTVGTGEIGKFTLTLSEVQDHDVFVLYTVKGSAINGTDYVFLKGRAKIKAGKTTKVIKVKPQGDLEGAVKKVVTLILSEGDGYVVGTTDKVKVKIFPAQ